MKNISKLGGIIMLLFCLVNANAKTTADITVKNNTDKKRTIETVQVAWESLAQKGLKPEKTVIIDDKRNQIPSQIIYDENDEPTMIIFQVELDANATVVYTAKKKKPEDYPSKVYGRIVPERYNDFAWENDIMGYRIYQKVLIPVDGPSGGIDVWSKRTTNLVVDKWYANIHYHDDHGEGCDSYKVGPTMGAGGISLLENGELKLHANYVGATIKAMGPIRMIVDFTFDEQSINGETVTMTKTLTYDAGSSINQFDVVFSGSEPTYDLVTGVVKREGAGEMVLNEKTGVLSYWEPELKNYGEKGLGIISPKSTRMGELDNHVVAYAQAVNGKSFTYYTGSCWNTANIFTNNMEWTKYLAQYKDQIEKPLTIIVK